MFPLYMFIEILTVNINIYHIRINLKALLKFTLKKHCLLTCLWCALKTNNIVLYNHWKINIKKIFRNHYNCQSSWKTFYVCGLLI